jgi:triacylglycerol lipase
VHGVVPAAVSASAALAARARALLHPPSVRGLVLEASWVAAHVALYPVGILQERTRPPIQRLRVSDLPPLQRALHVGDIEAAGTPILLVHGMVDNRSIFTMLRRSLHRRGFGQVRTLNYSPFTMDVRRAAGILAERVEELCADTGYERIHVVGHSLGGLVARYYVQRLGGDHRVHTLVTLGTPHHGTLTAHLAPPYPLARQLRPGSDLFRELDRPAPGCRTRVVSFWSDLDQLVLPADSARLAHPDLSCRDVPVRGVGHMSLPVDGQVVHDICLNLALLDPAGDTVTGVPQVPVSASPS